VIPAVLMVAGIVSVFGAVGMGLYGLLCCAIPWWLSH